MITGDGLHYCPVSLWSKAVKEIDGYKCIYCGSCGGSTVKTRLESHHVEMRELHPELSNVLENGVTLCHDCHYKAHNGSYTTRRYATRADKATGESYGMVQDFVKEYAENRIIFAVPKGQRDVIQAAASNAGKSVSEYVRDALAAQMERDGLK